MKYRYLIEYSGDSLDPIWLTTVNESGDTISSGRGFTSVEAAKAHAESLALSERDDDGDPIVLVWKPAPQKWQPDAIAVSQFLAPMYPDLPTD